jgi:hypothetical protein
MQRKSDEPMLENVAGRFWSRTERSSGCWRWTGARSKDGYGQIGIGNKILYTHRVAWELTHGSIPQGMWVLHHCDNKKCINPDHLFLGTRLDNIRDMLAKGRGKVPHMLAESNGSRKHPEKLVRGDKHYTRLHPELVTRGEKNGKAKLNSEQVREIRQRYATGAVSQRQLAREYDVHQTNIGFVVRGERWTHIPAQ